MYISINLENESIHPDYRASEDEEYPFKGENCPCFLLEERANSSYNILSKRQLLGMSNK